MDDSVFAQYNRQYQPTTGVQGNPQSMYGPANNYSQAMSLLRGSTGKGNGGGQQGAGAFANGNSYQMGQALQGLWNSQGSSSAYPTDTSGATSAPSSGGGMDMGSMASMAMAFI